jgi:hypothetical protein
VVLVVRLVEGLAPSTLIHKNHFSIVMKRIFLTEQHTQIRFSWYFPLPWLLTHSHWLEEAFSWLPTCENDLEQMKEKKSFIASVGNLSFETDFCYPVIRKARQLQLLRQMDFPSICYARTPQMDVKVVRKRKEATFFQQADIRKISFSIKIYPAGFGVINAYINLGGFVRTTLSNHLMKNIRCGPKESTLEQFVNYLKFLVLQKIFQKRYLEKIHTVLYGPKIRVNFISDFIDRQEFKKLSEILANNDSGTMKAKFKHNPKKNDHFCFAKNGLSFFTSTNLAKTKRKYLRTNLDFIADLIFGLESLLPIIPGFVTSHDREEEVNLEKLIIAISYSLNPEVLQAKNELSALLPSAGLRKWFELLSGIVNLEEKYDTMLSALLPRINELRVDRWYKIIQLFLLTNIPKVSSRTIERFRQEGIKVREVTTPQINLDKMNKEIVNYLVEELKKDLLARFDPFSTEKIIEEIIGYRTLNKIASHLEVTGREHAEFKQRVEILASTGLVQSIPYTGPGARKDSKQYRAAANHPYVSTAVKKVLAKNMISELKLE